MTDKERQTKLDELVARAAGGEEISLPEVEALMDGAGREFMFSCTKQLTQMAIRASYQRGVEAGLSAYREVCLIGLDKGRKLGMPEIVVETIRNYLNSVENARLAAKAEVEAGKKAPKAEPKSDAKTWVN